MILLLSISLLTPPGPDIDGRMADLFTHTDDDNLTEVDRLDMLKFGWRPVYEIADDQNEQKET
jgi:hypothetical protein